MSWKFPNPWKATSTKEPIVEPKTIAHFETPEGGERGSSSITVKFIRHGERNKEEELLDVGRAITRHTAQQSTESKRSFDFVQAVGSPSGRPEAQRWHSGGDYYARSTETANIYAHMLSPNPLPTTTDERLGYETMKYDHATIYDHAGIWNAAFDAYAESIGKTPDTMTEIEKISAAKQAQRAATQQLLSLSTPDAIGYKREAAGALASFLTDYRQIAMRLKKGTTGVIIAGTHGGTMEFLLQQALIMEKDGQRTVGLKTLDDIGGEFSPSEGYTVKITTDETGAEKDLTIVFDNKERPQQEFHLDIATVEELAKFYSSLHEPD